MGAPPESVGDGVCAHEQTDAVHGTQEDVSAGDSRSGRVQHEAAGEAGGTCSAADRHGLKGRILSQRYFKGPEIASASKNSADFRRKHLFSRRKTPRQLQLKNIPHFATVPVLP